ncbi:MAG: guanylate kinase [Chitinophagaceae bacterium]|nr:guanylate kinase [Chitinophagaceae bacterium]
MYTSNNKLIIIAAPSGAGKTSVTRHLLNMMPEQLAFSISCATRQPRNNEKDRVDYYFITIDDFKQKIDEEKFVEWEMVYEGKYYGTLKSEMERIWLQKKTPLLDVDVKGGINVQQLYPYNSLSLFIEPPSIDELERRLRARGTESEASLQARISKANYELSFKEQFDHIILNDDLERACAEAQDVVSNFLQSDR